MSEYHQNSMRARRAELFNDLATAGVEVLTDHGIAGDIAEQAAYALCDQIAQNWGGVVISIPRDHHYRLAVRDQAIYEEYAAGTSFYHLALKYQMSERGMRKLIERYRKRAIAARQRGLFDSEER